MPAATTSTAFAPFAGYPSQSGSTTFAVTKSPQKSIQNGTNLASVAPVELIHSADSVKAVPSAFKPVKEMSSTFQHCSTPSVSSTTSMSSGNRNSVQLGQPLRIPQPPFTRHSASPSSSSSMTSLSRFMPQNVRSSSTSIKPQIIGAGSGNPAAAVVAALNAARPDFATKTLNELVDLAHQKQRQIDANNAEIEERQKLIATAKMQNGDGIEQIRFLKSEIARHERELAQLSSAQRNARDFQIQNDVRRIELNGLQDIYSQDEQQIRQAISKNDSLIKQAELLYRRRASAASAAIAQQLQINSCSTVPTSPSKNITTLGQRPQAQVGPFQVQRPILNSSSDSEKFQFELLEQPPVSGTGKHQSQNQPVRLPQRGLTMKRPDKPPPPPKRNPNTVSIFGGSDTVRLLNNGVDQILPPSYSLVTGNPHYQQNFDQNVLRHGRTDQLSIRNDSMKALKRRSWLQQNDVPEADFMRVLLEEQKKGKTHISFNELHAEIVPTATKESVNGVTFRNNVISSPNLLRPKPIVENVTKLPTPVSSPEKFVPISAVLVSVSPNQEKPTELKEKYSESTVNTDPTNEELASRCIDSKSPQKVEEPKVVLEAVTVADKTLKSSVTKPKMPPPPAPELEEVLKKELESHKIEEASQNAKIEILELEPQMPKVELSKTEIVEVHNIEVNNEEEKIQPIQMESEDDDDHAQSDKLVAGNSGSDDDSVASSSVDEDISSSSDVVPVFMDSSVDENKPQPKSILKIPGKKKSKKNIVFDPFVLFLDGALEGQLDTVKENATKINDVSRPNDEGITALHNAICACHYEIVKFLVDAKADVNALDSDGWSPLHCAASCNNLAMLKLLVENGACVYATTLSDAEMPIRKCEEKEAGYDQCVSYLQMCDSWAGVINNGTVYAIYDYDAENDDELSFKEGDLLKVVNKEASEDGFWWLCELNEKRGLVPTNFFGIYPVLKVAERIKFKRFEIPSHLPESNSSPQASPKKPELDLSGAVEISANA